MMFLSRAVARCTALGAASAFARQSHSAMLRRLSQIAPVHKTLLSQLNWNFVPAVHDAPLKRSPLVREVVDLPPYPIIMFDPISLQLMPKREYNPHWRKRKNKHGFLR